MFSAKISATESLSFFFVLLCDIKKKKKIKQGKINLLKNAGNKLEKNWLNIRFNNTKITMKGN